MPTICPTCRAVILTGALNLKGGTARCAPCQKTWQLAELTEWALLGAVDVDTPPAGCHVNIMSNHTEWSASTKISIDHGFLFFAIFWNGMLSIFIALSCATTWKQITGSMPSWFPTLKENGFDSVSGVIFLWVFLTPFMLIGAWTFSMVMQSICGVVRVTLDEHNAVVFTGIGPIGRRQFFDPNHVTNVQIDVTKWAMNNRHLPLIEIEAERKIRFGIPLTDERRRWLAAALRRRLVPSA